MNGKAYKGMLMVGTLAIAAGVSTTPFPAKACIFFQEFEKSSKSGAQVSVWERIVYSLIEARNQTTQQHAPGETNASV